MSSSFCTLDEAFMAEQQKQPGANSGKKSKKARKQLEEGFEGMTPYSLPQKPDPSRPVPIVQSPPPMTGVPSQAVLARLESTDSAAAAQFFPLPGSTADDEEWQKAFTLEGSDAPLYTTRPDGSIPVNGKSTLWQQIPQPPSPIIGTSVLPNAIPTEINARLDQLTRQLEALTTGSTPTGMQSTAELFLFVAIGLFLLLALDTIMRFATVYIGKMKRGGYRRMPAQWS